MRGSALVLTLFNEELPPLYKGRFQSLYMKKTKALALRKDLLNLREINLDRGRTTEDLHGKAHPALCQVDLVDSSVERCERPGYDLDLLAHIEVLLRPEDLLLGHLARAAQDIAMLFRGKRLRRNLP